MDPCLEGFPVFRRNYHVCPGKNFSFSRLQRFAAHKIAEVGSCLPGCFFQQRSFNRADPDAED